MTSSTDSSETKIKYPNVVQLIFNDGLLTSCLLGNMKEEILSTILEGYNLLPSLRFINLYVIKFLLSGH